MKKKPKIKIIKGKPVMKLCMEGWHSLCPGYTEYLNGDQPCHCACHVQ